MAIDPVGFVGTVSETEFSKIMGAVGGHGVIGGYGGSSLAATRVPGARNMLIQPGECFAPGVHVTMDAAASAAAAAPANTSGLPRIDLMVMRINWTTHAAALILIAGTPSSSPEPPAYNQSPGVVFDVPLCQGVLPHSAADYSATTIAQGDRRVWLVDGLLAQTADSVAPTAFPGRLVTSPDNGKILLGGFGSERWTFRADSDTGWYDALTAPAGFGGTMKARIRNGMVKVAFNWTKLVTGTGTDVDFSVTLPSALWPGGGVDITETIWAGSSPCRLYISAGTGSMGFNDVTMAAGQIISGSPVWHYRYADL
jgi:hypothetical protein